MRVTAYPPVAQTFFLAVTRISETLTMMRLAMVALRGRHHRRADRPAAAAAAAGDGRGRVGLASAGDLGDRHSGHVDALMVALLMLGVWLLVRHRALAGAVSLTLAALVEALRDRRLPAFWRPWDWRVPAAVAATVVLCYLPYLGAGRGVLGFVTTRLPRRRRFHGRRAASGWSRWCARCSATCRA